MMKIIIVFDIDGVIRDVSGSYRRAIADTVEEFTQGKYRPSLGDIDALKNEGIWNNDWEASQELSDRYHKAQGMEVSIDYEQLVTFFQSRYRGSDPVNWNGYITTEPLLVSQDYFTQLKAEGIEWGFFSGATRGSAEYILKKRLGLDNPPLVAMEDGPGKPDPTGLLVVVEQLEETYPHGGLTPVIYVGDTVGDMYTVNRAREQQSDRTWVGVGIVPPHLHSQPEAHQQKLTEAGAIALFNSVEELTPQVVEKLFTH
ncbi:TIGR01548 family HAD-type hydrolase [Gloeocapsa sp. PCC 73106]|uniref:TIGR01548 family HAD-type hydrolase n=1 Tax=Gloeocapsa sp. PCC 73106 TaxID=102232 RepID=UPI0002ABE74D|nr:TIGR01548 family HAD-type hydrolase [Gloeocapsa sp. PCC 73106]ELR97365.1 haloacid dehalogenase superfamily protein, subfamily IA hydrolase, TIGR01548 [Gloeocapsa sp. PCC 73106]